MTDLKTRGEELLTKTFWTDEIAIPAGVFVGLYDDQTDALTDDADMGSVTSEPADGDYARLTYTLGADAPALTTGTNAENDWQVSFGEKTISLLNTTGTANTEYADSFFVGATFTADGDAGDTDHLVFTGRIHELDGTEKRYHLPSLDELDFSGTFTLQ